MTWTTFYKITFYLFFINKCSMHLFMIILVLIGYSLWPSHCFFLSVFDAGKQSMTYNICINNVSRCWLWCRDSHHMTYFTFLCHNVLISFLFYRKKASQYVILNTKNKIGKVIRKTLSILQYSSANCWTETALIAFSCTSHLNLSLYSILMFILRWSDTYRCFLNNIAAYLKYKKYLTLFILLLWIEIKTIIKSLYSYKNFWVKCTLTKELIQLTTCLNHKNKLETANDIPWTVAFYGYSWK